MAGDKFGGRPTKEELEKINKFTMKELTEDDVYVFNPLMIDNQETSYKSVLHINLLEKIMQDTVRGTALLMNHNNNQLPVGRSFDSKITGEYDNEGNQITSVFGKFYIDLGRNTQGGMTTDDIAKGIDSGTIFDVSIGFNASSWKCSICDNDIRDYMNCSHYPGEVYEVKDDDGVIRNKKCLVIVGEDGEGELLELSLVYAGACNRATIKQTFSNDSVRNSNEGTKLLLVDNFKNIPTSAKIFQYYTKDGSVLMTDTDVRTNGAEYLRKRSDEKVEFEKLMNLLKDSGIDFETEEELTAKIDLLKSASNELEAMKEDLNNLNSELDAKSKELEDVKSELADKETAINDLSSSMDSLKDELSKKTELVDEFRTDLINETLKSGVRVNGNTFNKDLFEKFLNTLSINEIKEAKSKFDDEATVKFGGARVTKTEDRTLSNRTGEELVPDREEEPEEYSAFITDKAIKYAEENSLTVKEAIVLMYEKYSKRSDK